MLIPGVITQSTVLVEHPELVAQRLGRFADVVGRERVIAGADCGFASFAGSNEVHPSIVWAKFKSLVDGSRHRQQAALAAVTDTPTHKIVMAPQKRAIPYSAATLTRYAMNESGGYWIARFPPSLKLRRTRGLRPPKPGGVGGSRAMTTESVGRVMACGPLN